MWIVAIAWMYVALMMAMAEATSADGTVLGAVVTFVFYGLAPMALVMYLLSTPARRRAQRQREAQEHAAEMAAEMGAETAAEMAMPPAVQTAINTAAGADSAAPLPATVDATAATAVSGDVNGRGLPAGDPVTPERKEP